MWDASRHVLYVRYAFPLPGEPGPKRHMDIVEHLSERGFHVTVVTAGTHFMTGQASRPPGQGLVEIVPCPGFTLARTRAVAGYRRTALRRAASYLAFMALAMYAGFLVRRRVGPYRIVLVDVSPVPSAVAGYLLALRRSRARLVLEVTDLPETMFALGYFARPAWRGLLARAFRVIYRRADAVVALTPGAGRHLAAQGVSERRLHVIPNWHSGRSPGEADDPALRARMGWDGRFIVLYAGSHGQAHDLTTILEAAALLQDRTDVRFVFVGDGERRAEYLARCEALGLTNCAFLGPRPREEVLRFVRAADVCVNAFHRGPFWRKVVGHKVFDYLEAERPVLFAGEGDTADLITNAGGGIVVPPEDPGALAEAVRRLEAQPAERRRMGERGRAYLCTWHSREEALGRLLKVLEDAA